MAALASLQDVRRVLRLAGDDDERDLYIAEALESAQEWVLRHLGWDPTTEGVFTEKFYNVREGGSVDLPRGVTVSAVRYFHNANSTPYVAQNLADYELQDSHRLRLQSPMPWPSSEGPVSLSSGTYARIEVDYTLGDGSGAVPPSIRDATAMIAGALWHRMTPEAQGITSESMGGYSYSLSSGVTGAGGGGDSWIPRSAILLLRPFRRSRVLVT